MEDINKRKFAIVEFPDEEVGDSLPMEIIGSSWIFYQNNETCCFWPTHIKTQEARIKFIVSDLPLDTTKCSVCKVNVKYYGSTYEKTAEKIKLLLNNQSSVSQSDSDAIGNIENRPIQKRRTVWKKMREDFLEDFSDEEYIPEPPKLPKTSVISTPFNKYSEKVPQAIDLGNEDVPNVGSRCTSRLSNITNSDKTITNSSSHSCNCTHEVVLKSVLAKVEEICRQQNYVIKLIQQSTHFDLGASTSTQDQLPGLPIECEADLNNFEMSLNEETFMTTMCLTLQVVGGKDVLDTARRIISRIISNKLALLLNWSGRNNKIGFSKFTNIVQLITVAVRKNPFSRMATQQEIEGVIKIWLRNAADRDGGRSKRIKKNITSINCED